MRYTILFGFLYVLFAISESLPHPPCGPVCQIYCQYGNELDEKGCPICKCKEPPTDPQNPCGNGQQPQEGVSCGLGSDQPCSIGYRCVTAPDDSYAVCCPVFHLPPAENE